MFGKGEGGKISAEFTMTHPNIVTAAITHSWGFWVMPSELKEPIDPLNSAPKSFCACVVSAGVATAVASSATTFCSAWPSKSKPACAIAWLSVSSLVRSATVTPEIVSFGNLELSLFLVSPGDTTLPIAILQYLEWKIDPSIAAVSLIQIAIISGAMVVTNRFVRLSQVV